MFHAARYHPPTRQHEESSDEEHDGHDGHGGHGEVRAGTILPLVSYFHCLRARSLQPRTPFHSLASLFSCLVPYFFCYFSTQVPSLPSLKLVGHFFASLAFFNYPVIQFHAPSIHWFICFIRFLVVHISRCLLASRGVFVYLLVPTSSRVSRHPFLSAPVPHLQNLYLTSSLPVSPRSAFIFLCSLSSILLLFIALVWFCVLAHRMMAHG